MKNILKSKRGFTITEIMAAALIISIAVGGTFSAYTLSYYFSNRFKHRTMGIHRAAGIADYLRYRVPGGYNDAALSDGDHAGLPAGMPALSTWDLNDEVNNLSAEYNVSKAWFVNGAETSTDPNNDGDNDPETGTPPYFKKIVVTLEWDERKGA